MKHQNLEDRLVRFAAQVIWTVENLPVNYANQHLGKQLLRSGTSAALNYGETQGAESRADFIHKLKVSLKELKESFVCMKILKISEKGLPEGFEDLFNENNELVAIFISSVKTAQENNPNKK